MHLCQYISRRISRNFVALLSAAVLAVSIFSVVPAAALQAQVRVNDKDMATMMRNLRDDSKSFRPSFDAAVRKSTIRKTSQANDAKNLAKTFEKQTDYMLRRFKKHHKGQGDLTAVSSTAQQIDALLSSVQLGPEVTAKWERIRAELHPIAMAYGVDDHFGRGEMRPSRDSD